MYISKDIKTKIANKNRFELLELARKADNEEAFVALEESPNRYEETSRILGLENHYARYEELVDEEMNRDYQKVTELITSYRNFLLAKICFPDEV